MTESDVQEYYRSWSLIRSDPDVFTSMIKRYGITGVVAEDVLTLETFTDLSKDNTFGIILAYKYSEDPLPKNINTEDPDTKNITFTAQLIVNSCATVGLLNVLSNVDIERGDIIQNFLDFSKDFESIDRGLALGSYPEIRDIHNSYHFDERNNDADDEQEEQDQEGVYGVERTASESDLTCSDKENNGVSNACHFVGYIFKNDYIWELDGLKLHPIKIQRVNRRANWLKLLKPILTAKIKSSQFTANVISIVKDPISLKEEQLKGLLDQINELTEELSKEQHKIPVSSPSTNRSRIAINKLNKKKGALENQTTQLENEIKSDKSDIAAKMTNVGRVLDEYFSFINETARIAFSRGFYLQDFRRTSESFRESRGQETSLIEKKNENIFKKDKGKGRAIEFTPTPSENKKDRIRSSAAEKVQKGRGKTKTSTSGSSQRGTGRGHSCDESKVEYTASTSKYIQKETTRVIEGMQARKRKLDDEADNEFDLLPGRKK